MAASTIPRPVQAPFAGDAAEADPALALNGTLFDFSDDEAPEDEAPDEDEDDYNTHGVKTRYGDAPPQDPAAFAEYVAAFLTPIDLDAEGEAGWRMMRAVEALYGYRCPLTLAAPTPDDFVAWVLQSWDRHAAAHWPRVHEAEQHRAMRDGKQWVSSNGKGPWREPPKPKDLVRVVVNMIGPALDWRLQVLTENKPGFRTRPATNDPDDVRKAQSTQMALEYQFYQQDMEQVIREAAYWAQTDGCAFLHTYWDTERGPWHEFGANRQKLGEVSSCVHRIEQVRVSANATGTQRPSYWIVRETLPTAETVAAYGSLVASEAGSTYGYPGLRDNMPRRGRGAMTTGLDSAAAVNQRLDGQETTERFIFYAEPSEFLPEGLHVVIVGRTVVYVNTLLTGRVPLVRWTDGSSDPSFYPKAVMRDWIDAQMRLNAVYSKLIENIRKNSGGRLLAKPNAIVHETLTGAADSIIEVRSPGSIDEVVRPLAGFSIGRDALEVLAAEVKRLEDLTGYTDAARGGMSATASGRAILAVREQLERIFASGIYAACRAMRDWGQITAGFMAWGYELPRSIAVLGKNRPDLGRSLSKDDVDGAADVHMDPETMMPTPRSVQLYQLDDLFQKGILGPEEYRERLGFQLTNDIQTPKSVHVARAKRVVDAIRNGFQVPPIRWQDDEAVHQDVLEKDMILAPDVPEEQVTQAHERWVALAQQQARKAGAMSAPPPAMGGGGGRSGEPLPAQNAPTMALPNGTLPTEPLMQQQTQQTAAARMFENVAPQ